MPATTNVTQMRQNAQHACQAVPDNPYTRFLEGMKRAAPKRGDGHIRDIDEAPDALCDLASYFAQIPTGKLASCWVACLVDAVDPAEAGNVARALIVVAQRLHAVTFTTPDVPCPRQALDGEHAMPFKIETTTPPVDLKTAKKTPPHIRDACETLRTAPMTWRWFVWDNCPKGAAFKRAAKQLIALWPSVDVYLDAEEKAIVSNAGSGPRIGAAPPAANNGTHKPGTNVVGARAESQAPRVLEVLRKHGGPMSVTEIKIAMGLTQSPGAAIGLLSDRGEVLTEDGPDGKTMVELAGAPVPR